MDQTVTEPGVPRFADRPNNAPRTSTNGSYAETLTPPSPRQLLERLFDRLVANQQILYETDQFHLIPIHSSTLLFTEDMAAQILEACENNTRMSDYLYFLLQYGLNRHGELSDYENFWALHKLGAFHNQQPKIYAVLGFCLFIMDTVSRFPNENNLTFFSACRKNDFKLDVDSNYDRWELRQKFIAVLTDLGLYNETHSYMKDIVDEWYEKGSFTLDNGTSQGDIHFQESNGKLSGTFIHLTHMLCSFDKNDPLAQPAYVIAYALGNKFNMQYLQNPQIPDKGKAAIHYTLRIMQNPLEIAAILRSSGQMKFVRGIEAIKTEFPNAKRQPVNLEGIKFLRDNITAMPPEIITPLLEIMQAERESLIAIPGKNSENCYPKKDILGRPHRECEATRNNSGRIPAFFRILIALGEISDKWTEKDRSLKFRHTTAHELSHTAYSAKAILENEFLSGKYPDGKSCLPNDGHLPGSYIRERKEKLEAICGRIDELEISSPADYKRFFGDESITDYIIVGKLLSKVKPWWYSYTELEYEEERKANVIGFACGQFAPDIRPYDNAFHGSYNPNDPDVVNELREYVAEEIQFLALARDLVCNANGKTDIRSTMRDFRSRFTKTPSAAEAVLN